MRLPLYRDNEVRRYAQNLGDVVTFKIIDTFASVVSLIIIDELIA